MSSRFNLSATQLDLKAELRLLFYVSEEGASTRLILCITSYIGLEQKLSRFVFVFYGSGPELL